MDMAVIKADIVVERGLGKIVELRMCENETLFLSQRIHQLSDFVLIQRCISLTKSGDASGARRKQSQKIPLQHQGGEIKDQRWFNLGIWIEIQLCTKYVTIVVNDLQCLMQMQVIDRTGQRP